MRFPMTTHEHLRRAACALAVLLAGSGAVRAEGQEIGEEPGTREGALFLLLPVGAQGVGLGRAMTALHSEEGAFWNPASLAEQSERRAMVYRGDQISGEATAANVLLPGRAWVRSACPTSCSTAAARTCGTNSGMSWDPFRCETTWGSRASRPRCRDALTPVST